jgi:PTH2 family peptidyl-tRNA hydrolase
MLSILENYTDFTHSCDYVTQEDAQNYVVYILVNGGLPMSKGKIAAQVGHGIHKLTEYCGKHKKKHWKKYNANGCPKIVLKTQNQDELLEIINSTQHLHKSYVIDEGRTQIPPDSLTVIAYEPILKEHVPKVLQKLKLL